MSKEEQISHLLEAPSIEGSVEHSLASGFFSCGPWPESDWWKSFQSESLNTLISEALLQNPSIQAVQQRVEKAKQSAIVTRSDLFPLLFFDADETWQYLSKNGLFRALNPKIPLNCNLVDLTLSFTYEFDFWGKNRNLFRAALGETKAREAEEADVRLIVTTSLAQAFFALKTNLLRKKLYEELVTVREEILDLQDLLLEKALNSLLTPLLSEENLFEAAKWLSSIEKEIETDRHLINILRGKGPDAPFEFGDEEISSLDSLALPQDLSIDLLSRRPDLMAQIWRVESLAHDVGAAKADFYPNINLTAFGGLESVLYHTLFKGSSKTWGVSPAIHLPIFTAGAIRANVRAKKALFDEAVYSYNNLILKSTQEVADLLSLAKSIFQQKDDQEQIVDAAAQRFDLTDLRLRKGLDNRLTWFFAQEEWLLKELDNVTLLYSEYLAAIKLIKALGGGYRSEYGLPLKSEAANG